MDNLLGKRALGKFILCSLPLKMHLGALAGSTVGCKLSFVLMCTARLLIKFVMDAIL